MSIERAIAQLLIRTPLPWLVLAALAVVMWSEFPTWEGRFLPVTSRFTIESREVAPLQDHQILHLSFTKHRSCKYLSMAAYWQDADGSLHRVPWRNADGASDARGQDRTRRAGDNRTSLIVDTTMPVDRLEMYTRHSCHPLWDTVTQVWP